MINKTVIKNSKISEFESKNTRDFRNIYANTTSISANNVEMRMDFGIADPRNKVIERETSVHMNLNAARSLFNSLEDFFKNIDNIK